MEKSYPDRFLSIEEVSEMVGFSRSSILRREEAGHFPRRRKLGGCQGPRGRVGYLLSEVLAWMHSRKAVPLPLSLPHGESRGQQRTE